jgi:hypothetical protein
VASRPEAFSFERESGAQSNTARAGPAAQQAQQGAFKYLTSSLRFAGLDSLDVELLPAVTFDSPNQYKICHEMFMPFFYSSS